MKNKPIIVTKENIREICYDIVFLGEYLKFLDLLISNPDIKNMKSNFIYTSQKVELREIYITLYKDAIANYFTDLFCDKIIDESSLTGVFRDIIKRAGLGKK